MCSGVRYVHRYPTCKDRAATAGSLLWRFILQYGVALIGSGGGGAWPGFVEPWYDPNTYSIIQQFATGPNTDDIILLRPGTVSSIHAVGLVVEGGLQGYQFLNQFNDVYGWDLSHARRVRWKACQHDFGHQVFFPIRFSRVGNGNAEVVEYAQQCIQTPPIDWQNSPLPPLPPGPLANMHPQPCDP